MVLLHLAFFSPDRRGQGDEMFVLGKQDFYSCLRQVRLVRGGPRSLTATEVSGSMRAELSNTFSSLDALINTKGPGHEPEEKLT